MTHWENVPEDIEDWYGFVYMIINKQTNQKYIGRKYFHSYKKGKRSKESDWATYTSSSKELNDAIKNEGLDNFAFIILAVFKTRQEVNYAEVEEQITRNVLKTRLESGEFEYYNQNIMSKFFRPKDYGTPEYYSKIDSLSKAMKQKYLDGMQHPMKGRVHPSKGKKLPQTAHYKNKGLLNYNNGKINKRFPIGVAPPEGFVPGMLIFNPRKKKEVVREERGCLTCDKKFVPKGTQVYCSPPCVLIAKRKRDRERHQEKREGKPDRRRKKV